MDVGIALFEYTKKSPISLAIRLATKSVYSHAALLLDSQMFDASERRGNVSYAGYVNDYDNGNRNVLVYHLNPIIKNLNETKEKIYNYLIHNLGKKYDYKGVLGWLFNLNDNKRFYCFEFVIDFLNNVILENVEDNEVIKKIEHLNNKISHMNRVSGDDVEEYLKIINAVPYYYSKCRNFVW